MVSPRFRSVCHRLKRVFRAARAEGFYEALECRARRRSSRGYVRLGESDYADSFDARPFPSFPLTGLDESSVRVRDYNAIHRRLVNRDSSLSLDRDRYR